MLYADGSAYVGQWAYDKANGYGVLETGNGSTLEGQWLDFV